MWLIVTTLGFDPGASESFQARCVGAFGCLDLIDPKTGERVMQLGEPLTPEMQTFKQAMWPLAAPPKSRIATATFDNLNVEDLFWHLEAWQCLILG